MVWAIAVAKQNCLKHTEWDVTEYFSDDLTTGHCNGFESVGYTTLLWCNAPGCECEI